MAKRNQKKTPKLTLQEQYQGCPRANLFKRLGAYIYDLFALVAVLMLSGIVAILVVIIASVIIVMVFLETKTTDCRLKNF